MMDHCSTSQGVLATVSTLRDSVFVFAYRAQNTVLHFAALLSKAYNEY